MKVCVPYEPHYKADGLVSIVLPLDHTIFSSLPAEMLWKGIRLGKKAEFHITLLHVQKAAELAHRSREEIVSLFNAFVEGHPIRLVSFTNDLRYTEEDEKKTILVRCTVANLDGLFASLNSAFRISMPTQPAHVTIYSLDPFVGIHVNSDEKMESLERVHLPELEAALKKISLV